MHITLRLGKYSVRFNRIDLIVMAITAAIVVACGSTWAILRTDTSKSSSIPVVTDNSYTSKPSTDIVVAPLTEPIVTHDERKDLPSSGPSTPQPLNDTDKCSHTVSEYTTKLASLDAEIQEQLDIMRNIQVSLDLMSGGVLHQADMQQKFRAASDKADELIEQYGALKDEYQNKLLDSGCTDELKKLLY